MVWFGLGECGLMSKIMSFFFFFFFRYHFSYFSLVFLSTAIVCLKTIFHTKLCSMAIQNHFASDFCFEIPILHVGLSLLISRTNAFP